MTNLQPVLVGGNGIGTDLTIHLSESSDSLLVMLGPALLERIGCSTETLQYRMLVGRLVNAGWTMAQLQRTFKHDPRTMRKWANGLLTDDVDEMVRAFRGRGSDRKVTGAITRYAKQRYRVLRECCRDYRRTIRGEVVDLFDEKLSREVLRRLFREADAEDAVRLPTSHDGPAHAQDQGTGCPEEADSGTDAGPNDNPSPDPEADPEPMWELPPALAGAPSRPVGLHHSGMVLFLMLLARFTRLRPGAAGVQTQWIGQILQGAVNIENSRLISVEDLAWFTGPVQPVTDGQRRELQRIAGKEIATDIYRVNVRMLADGPRSGWVYYYDPHSKEYTGSQPLPKGWCGRHHCIAKIMNLDMIHTESGRPCFIQHYTSFYDLRERFFMTLELFNGLFSESRRRGRTFVLDRGIYGLEALQRFAAVGDFVLTWEKNCRGDGWEGHEPDRVFVRTRTRNHARDLMHYRFECREEPWSRDPSVRRILVRATNPDGRTATVAILCSNPDMDIERAVWLMFNRWVQENSFKYLDKHFGLNQLTSYATTTFEERADEFRDRPVDCPEYRERKKECTRHENRLAKLLLQREKSEDIMHECREIVGRKMKNRKKMHDTFSEMSEQMERDPESVPTADLERLADRLEHNRKAREDAGGKYKKAHEKLEKLKPEIEALKQTVSDLHSKLDAAVRTKSRLRLLIDGCYRFHDTRCKATMDALRITASNMFAVLMDTFRPVYNNHRNDHAMLRQLTRADGFLHRDGDTVHVRLWLKGRFQNSQRRAFRVFLNTVTEQINDSLAPGTPKLSIGLLDQPPTL